MLTFSYPYGYGSIPINTIFRGMNIHLPAILMFTRGTRFWHTAIYHVASFTSFDESRRRLGFRHQRDLGFQSDTRRSPRRIVLADQMDKSFFWLHLYEYIYIWIYIYTVLYWYIYIYILCGYIYIYTVLYWYIHIYCIIWIYIYMAWTYAYIHQMFHFRVWLQYETSKSTQENAGDMSAITEGMVMDHDIFWDTLW